MTKSFQGLRVLDFSTTIAGPHCTRMLADMGAEVIKVETTEGETMRTRPPVRNNCSTAFGQLNVGKNSLVLDLKSAGGIEVIRRLIASTDVLVENFRPGVMRRLKLDYDSLKGINPKLIYCSISGYGQTGPSAELPAYAPVIHAASGYEMAHLAYQPGRSRPDYCGIYHADVLTGVYAFGAVSAALYQRHGTGLGQHIDVSMLESMLSLTLNEVQWSQFEVKPPQRPMFGPIETADGYVMVAIASEKTFQSLMKVIGHPEWVSDPRFAAYADRRENWASLMDGRRSLVARGDDRKLPHCAQCRGCSEFGLSHGGAGTGRSANRASRRAGRGRGWRRHVQGSQPAIPDVRGRASRRPSGWQRWASTRSRICGRPGFRKMKSRPSPASGWRQRRVDQARREKACGFSTGAILWPCRRLQFQPICGAVVDDPEYRTLGLGGRASNESGNPLARLCANVSCRGIWPCFGGKSLGCKSRQCPKAGRQHHRRPRG